jgi:predicted dehydrogenase
LLNQLKTDWGPRSGSHNIHYRVNAGQLDRGSWYGLAETEGTRFIGEGGHFIDTASWWLGSDPVAVTATASQAGIDDLTATYLYPDGSTATIFYWTGGNPALPKERIEIFGQQRAAVFENFERYDLWPGSSKIARRTRGIDKGQKDQLAAFVAAVKSAAPMPIGLTSLLATTKATLATTRSAVAGSRISLAD